MATLKSKTLAAILAPKFQTGGEVSPVPEPDKKPGVPVYTSSFEKANQKDVLSVAKVTRKLSIGITPFAAEDPALAGKMERYSVKCAVDATNRAEAMLMANLAFMRGPGAVSYNRDDAFLNLLSWLPKADLIAVYVDYGITPAMQTAINLAISKNKKIEYRSIGNIA